MQHLFAFAHADEQLPYNTIIDALKKDFKEYEQLLAANYRLIDPPKAVVWTTPEYANTIFSTSPLPAYTRNEAIFFSPDQAFWLATFRQQQGPAFDPLIQQYYQEHLYEQLREILCHELTHHIDLFPGDFDDYDQSDIWVEEGTAFYLPRKLLLSTKDYQELREVERQIAKRLQPLYGQHAVQLFGKASYSQSIDAIMFEYMRSFLLIDAFLTKNYGGDELAFLADYNQFFALRHQISFEAYFAVDLTQLWEEILRD